MKADIFFFISSIGFIILFVISGALLVYTIRAVRAFTRVMNMIEKDVQNIGDASKEMLADVRDSMLFRFIFKKKRKH